MRSRWCNASQNSVSICLALLVIGEKVRLLPCMHYYHSHCVDPWILERNHCPVCRCLLICCSLSRTCKTCYYDSIAPQKLQIPRCHPSTRGGVLILIGNLRKLPGSQKWTLGSAGSSGACRFKRPFIARNINKKYNKDKYVTKAGHRHNLAVPSLQPVARYGADG